MNTKERIEMSLNKAIKHKKEHRKEYYGSKAVDKTCRNHGSCAWCEENRRYREYKLEEAADIDEKEWESECEV